jgi:hypothetical protein
LITALACLEVGLPIATTLHAEEIAGPRLQFETTEHDFGKINAGDIVSCEFRFTNTGLGPLEILEVKTSCGCTTTSGKDQQSLTAGQTGVIPVRFNSRGFSGTVHKTVRVKSNDPSQPDHLLRFKANVWTPIQLEPKTTVFYYDASSSTGETKVVRIRNNQEEPLELLTPETTHPNFQLELKTVEPGKEFELLVQTVPPLGTGTLSMPISLRSSDSETVALKTHVYAFEREPVFVSPKVIRMAAGRVQSAKTIPVLIRNQSSLELELSEPHSSIPEVKLSLTELQPGKLFRLAAEFPAGVVMEAQSTAEITIASNHPRHQQIRIPISLMTSSSPALRTTTAR